MTYQGQGQPSTPTESTPFADALKRSIATESGESVEDTLPDDGEEAQPVESEGEQPEAEAEAAPDDGQAEAPQMAEVEIDGKKLQVPAEAKDYLLRQADYTRKTQEVAQLRESVEREKATVERTTQVMREMWPTIAELASTQQRLHALSQVDWNTLQSQDPIEHNRLRLEAVESQNKLQYLAAQIDRYNAHIDEMRARAMAEETARNLPKARELVPNLDQRKGELLEVGKSYGFQETELRSITDPRVVKALADLADYKRAVTNKVNVQRQVAATPPVLKPGTKVPAVAPNVELKKAMHALRTDNSDEAIVRAMRAQRKGR